MWIKLPCLIQEIHKSAWHRIYIKLRVPTFNLDLKTKAGGDEKRFGRTNTRRGTSIHCNFQIAIRDEEKMRHRRKPKAPIESLGPVDV
jgi:hypothetical protein